MVYQFDAFFSYKRDPESDDWHERVKDKLTYWLKQELSRTDVRLFFDREEIRSGDRWRSKMATALKASRCAVCLWSPLYFRSRWCLSEWMTFVERGKLCRSELVMPASYFDGETFPSVAREIQFTDFSDYASTMPGFWGTEAAVDFERERLRPFATALANMIRRAPEYSEQFPIVEVEDGLIQPELAIERIANG